MIKQTVARTGAILIAIALAGAGCGSDPEMGGPVTGTAGTSPTTAGTTGGPVVAPPTAAGTSAVGTAGRGGVVGTAGTAPVATAGTGAAQPVAGAGTAGPGGAGAPPVASNNILPCDVQKALAQNCATCHGTEPIGGAPMPLVTWDDFQKAAPTMPTKKVHEVVKLRINDKARPMPPGATMSEPHLTMLNTWLTGGATAGGETDKTCDAAPPANEPGKLSFGPLTPLPGEKCYDFPVHNGVGITDKTPYEVVPGEHYVQFYYDAPWPTGTLGTRYGAKYDNQKVIHHWLMFGSDEFDAAGSYKVAPLPTLLGVNAYLIAGWAVGGANMEMPEDVGFELPPEGHKIDIQWHYYNTTSQTTTDSSAVQVCTMPAGSRKNVAAITWVGTEDLNGNVWFGGAGMPAHQMSTFGGTCNPLRAGMNATDPIKIIGFWPHMHQLGVNMKTVINRKGGMKETVFDKPFDFNYQIHYMQNHDLNPGDTLTATCTFNNTTDRGVPFGESSDTEMCYNFVMSYPAHALENGVPSLIGATNTCW